MGVPIPMKTGMGVILAGCMVLGALAQDKPVLPDAQVEANVLRALASAPELATQNIQTTTVYGVVTLTGSANDEASRTRAENLTARAEGVKKVVDEMGIGRAPANRDAQNQSDVNAAGPAQEANNGLVLQSDGTYAPAQPGDPSAPPTAQEGNTSNGAPVPQQNAQPEPGYVSPPAPPANEQASPQANGQYPPQGNGQYPPQGNGQYPPPDGRQYPPRRPMYNNGVAYAHPVPGGQEGGRSVTIPNGALLRIRINQGLSTHHTQPGSIFDATVLNDVVADGAVAIPRGASVQGTVVDVKDAGALKGRGELALQLTRLTLGGQNYTLVSDTWTRTGADKSLRTVNSALGLGAIGAVIGALAGGGEGAAIGAGVGGAAGIASSASSPGGRVVIPPEAVLTFHLAQPATVATVSEQEMARLAYSAGSNQPTYPVVRRRYYPEPYYGPYGPYYYPRY
ncbi:MAG: BON domain-containing protein [Acidobacteriaceae bacterium]